MNKGLDSRGRHALVCAAGWLAALLAVAPAVAVSPADDAVGGLEAAELFLPLADKRALALDSPAAVAARRVAVDPAVVERGARRLAFELFESGRHEAVLTGVEWRAPGDLTWRGRMVDGGGRVVITYKQGAFAGLILTADGVYELSQIAPGQQRLEKIDTALFPRSCDGAIDPVELGLLPPGGPSPAPGGLEKSGAGQEEAARDGTAKDSAGVIDLLGVYTPQALARAGSHAAMAAHVQAAVDVSNTALRDSRVATRFNLVAVEPVPHNDSGDIEDDLFWLLDDPGVAALRNRYRADLVGLSTVGGGCGVGFVMRQPGASFERFGFMVTSRFCAVALATYAHEHGHNMGLEHDPPNGPPPHQASYPWSFGHFVEDSFRTVMSYDTHCDNCPRYNNFSNPDVQVLGLPSGIPGERDNARTLDLTAPIVANFRQSGGGGGGGGGLAAPRGLEVELDGLTALLSWEDAAGNEGGYRIYRGGATGSLARVAELPADSVYFSDTGLAPQTVYRYQVAAFLVATERRSEVVTVTTPSVAPVSVQIVPPPLVPAPGEPIELVAVTAGPVTGARWRLDPGAVGYSPAPCAADRVCTTHIFRQTGSFVVEVEVVGDLGQKATAQALVTVAGDAPAWVRKESFVQSVIFGPRGNTGVFRSNCWSHNAGTAATLVELTYLPRGAGNPSPDKRWLTLAPGESVFLPNALEELFAESDTQGSLGLAHSVAELPGSGSATPDVTTFCRSFVEIAGQPGSFGQFVGEERAESWSAAPKVVTGVLLDDAFGSTLLAANLDARGGRVDVELFDATGAAVGTAASFALGARTMRFRPLAQLFPEAKSHAGPFTARFSTADGIRFAASATLLENGSEDQIFIPAREPDPAKALFVPRVTTAESQFGAFLVSRLIAKNNAPSPTVLHFELWRRGQVNLEPLTATRTLPPQGVLVVDNLVSDLFGLETGVGALRIEWSNPEGIAPRVVTYSLNEQGAGGKRFGMLVDSRSAEGAASVEALDFGAEQSSLFRADFGILNLRPETTLVEVTLKEAGGRVVATASLTLKPSQHLERNLEGIFRDQSIGRGHNWTVVTRVVAGGPVITYLANTNVSGDIFFVPGRAR